MNRHIIWRLFVAVVLTTVVWSAIGLEVYGWNDSGSGGTLLDVFRGRSNSSNSNEVVSEPIPNNSNYGAYNVPAPQMTNVPATQTPYESQMNGFPGGAENNSNSRFIAPVPMQPQPAVQNKRSIKSWFLGSDPNPSQYVEPAPTLVPAYNSPHSHGAQQAFSSRPKSQYPVVPLDSKDFQPQEGAIYNEKGEMIYSPESGGVLPEGADGEVIYDNRDEVVYSNNGAMPYNESESEVKRVITGRRAVAGRSAAPVNQERFFNRQGSVSNGSAHPVLEPTPSPMPINPYAQQSTVTAGNPPVGSGNARGNSANSGTLKLESGSSAFSKTYKPVPRVTSVPTEPVMDMTGPELADAMPQLGNREQITGRSQETLDANHSPLTNSKSIPDSQPIPAAQATPRPAVGSSMSPSPIIEDITNASPLENLSEKKEEAPVLEPVPESVPELDVPKETEDNRQEEVDSSENTPSASQTPLATRNSQLATQEPLIIEINGPEVVEFGKNEMFSLSVINTTDSVRRDIDLSVHPEGFGNDKTASINLEQLAPGEKKSIFMKLNARQYNNLSLTAKVQDSLGFKTSKTINVNVKNESVKISILPPQAGNAYVGHPTQYIVRIVNNADKDIALNAMAFFGNGIEPIRATGAPNTIQSGQVVVNKPIELKKGEMRDLKIIAVAFQPGVHKILIQLIDSCGATYAAKESCAYRQREFDDDESETIETDARIELTPGKSEIGVWKPAGPAGVKQEQLGSSNEQLAIDANAEPTPHSSPLTPNSQTQEVSSTPALNAADAVPLTQPDQGPKGDLIMPMFAQ